MNAAEKRLVGADYVADVLGLSRAGAYRIMRALNHELEEAGVKTLPGRVSLAYLEQRFFSLPDKEAKSDVGEP